MQKIKVAIIGYGNLGRGVEKALKKTEDMELFGIFTRRDPTHLKTGGGRAYAVEELPKLAKEIDVAILCGGSATDLMTQSPDLVRFLPIVDSFDTHAKIPEHFAEVDRVARENHQLAIISTGWDPGLFSLHRVIAEAVLPVGESYTFWGKGVSQGHSDAIRRIPKVKMAVQYTLPNENALEAIYRMETPKLTTGEKHTRLCYVVAEEGTGEEDLEEIRKKIVTMPNYFDEYETTVHFIDEETMERDHCGMPHGGHVIRIGETGEGTRQLYEFQLALGSNPEFTASVNVACARACVKRAKKGEVGARTILDLSAAELSPLSADELRRRYL